MSLERAGDTVRIPGRGGYGSEGCLTRRFRSRFPGRNGYNLGSEVFPCRCEITFDHRSPPDPPGRDSTVVGP